MNAIELTHWQIDEAARKIHRALSGLGEEDWDFRSTDAAMSAREIVEHLCECGLAFRKQQNGEKHEWGSYRASDRSPNALLTEFDAYRAEAKELVSKGGDDALKHAIEYIAEHDAYHLGQLCTMRLTLDPNWNPYSIYEAS